MILNCGNIYIERQIEREIYVRQGDRQVFIVKVVIYVWGK